jgi:hypothetical protein
MDETKNNILQEILCFDNKKHCSNCNNIKPVDDFYKNKNTKDGCGSWCKECISKNNKTLNYNIDVNLKEKLCTKCKLVFSIDNFGKNKRNLDGYKPWCNKCTSIYNKSINNSPVNLKEKQCIQCNIVKPIKNFSIRKSNSDGYSCKCKSCCSKNIPNTLKQKYIKWKSGAKQRNILFDLTIDDLQKIPLVCYYTGKFLIYEPNKYNTVSLDRIDSNKPYTKNNIAFCCGFINTMKNELTYDQFICACRTIVQYYDNKNGSF